MVLSRQLYNANTRELVDSGMEGHNTFTMLTLWSKYYERSWNCCYADTVGIGMMKGHTNFPVQWNKKCRISPYTVKGVVKGYKILTVLTLEWNEKWGITAYTVKGVMKGHKTLALLMLEWNEKCRIMVYMVKGVVKGHKTLALLTLEWNEKCRITVYTVKGVVKGHKSLAMLRVIKLQPC